MSLIKILGCSGSIGEHGYTTSQLINNDTLMVGAGPENPRVDSSILSLATIYLFPNSLLIKLVTAFISF